MFFKKYGDIIVGLFFTALSIALMIMARALPKSRVMAIGPDFMPTVIGTVALILALFLLFTSIKNFKLNAKMAEESGADNCDYVRVISSIILILAYVCTLKPVGFIISTLVYLLLQMFVLAPVEERNKKGILKLIVIDVVFTMVVFFLFRYGFKIILPAGIFTITL